ncbi:CATP2 small subunit catalase encoded by the catP2 protein [Triangularia setosa]|uniref:CATP2 small subunit catalase encoded by the catP2 protein n=1 Tax=Triangularia setosa TaxID=2587417 RepID=A0AAN6W1K2_9PEZI|nr:CATP2 small subunit catalase encoded by the catP2 protein [Podospora setosa]
MSGLNSNQMDPHQHPLKATATGTAAELVPDASAGGKREDDALYFTNSEAIPFLDPAHSKTIGGIPVATDVFLFQKQQHFNRSKPLERMVYPCGSGAFDLTKADFLSSVGEKTPVFTRFPTVTFGQGNYDIVGLNFPVLFCRDPIQGPDVIRSQSRNPCNFLLDYDALFDLLANTPEANHAGLMFFSDQGTPVGWRYNHGYGCHTFKWVNKKGKFVYIKYTFLAKHGQKQFTDSEAVVMCGRDPNYSKHDLWDAIEAGEGIEWTAYVQIMQPEQADPDILGDQFLLKEFGRLVLNKNPENFTRDVEQAAFSPGIEDPPDPLLQLRMFFYRDAQYHRIGVNLHQIPVNCPFMTKSYASLNFNGPMRSEANHAGNKQPDAAEALYAVSDNIMSRKSHYWHEGKKNDYAQATQLWARVMIPQQRENTTQNTAKYLGLVKYSRFRYAFEPKKYLAQLYNISLDYSEGVFQLLPAPQFDMNEVKSLAENAYTWYKEKKFQPLNGKKLTGFIPPVLFITIN